MTQVDAYLSRLSFWLPAKQRQRILPEIHNALLDRLDVAAAAAGHPLNYEEIAREIAAFGRPAIVAAGYVEVQAVIPGMLAFFYWRVLSIAVSAVVAVQLVVVVIHGGMTEASYGEYLADAARRAGWGLLAAFAVVTLVFIVLGRSVRAPTTCHRSSS